MQSNAAGAQAIVFTYRDPGPDHLCESSNVVSRQPGGAWTEPQAVGSCDTTLSVSPAGEVFALEQTTTGDIIIETGIAGSPLTSYTQLTHHEDTSDGFTSKPDVIAFDSAGTPTLIYTTNPNSGPGYAIAAATRGGGGAWDAEAIASSTDDLRGVVSGMAPDGHMAVAWLNTNLDSGTMVTTYTIRSASRAAGATSWTAIAPDAFPASTDIVGSLVMKPDPQNRFTLLYEHVTGADQYIDAATLSAPPAPAWDTPQQIPHTPLNGTPQVAGLAIDSAGNVLAAGFDGNGTGSSIWYATRPAGASGWSAADLFPPDTTTDESKPSVSFDAGDNATITFPWGTNKTIRYFTRPAGGSVFTEQEAPPSGGQPAQTTTDADGYVTATWVGTDGITYTSVYDPVAPTIDGVTPPSSPIAGSPATFVIDGSDVWGPVSFTIDFGDGQSASGRLAHRTRSLRFARVTGGGTVQHTYASPGDYTATIAVVDGAANSRSTTVPVAVGAAPAAPPVAPLPPVIAGLPDPVLGVTANVLAVRNPVYIKQPGQTKFVRLTLPAQIKIGSIIDARKGEVRITIRDPKGLLDTADFYAGEFKILQRTTGSTFASMVLYGGSFRGCPHAPRAILSRKRLSPKRSVRHLWGSGTGSFRTVGRFSSATIRGTQWETDDRCNGTLTRVKVGKVGVFDFVKHKTIVVRAKHRYFAQPRAKKHG